jgi:two-component system nitrogen regulation response regulator NtrX
MAYPWPGNVRELKNLIERLMILTTEAQEGAPIAPNDLMIHLQVDSFSAAVGGHHTEDAKNLAMSARNLRDARSEFEKEFILKTLKENDWNVSKASSVLGIERSHLHKKMKSYGIEHED